MNIALRYAVLVGLFAVPFIPFIVSSSMFFPFITGKNFTFRILVEIIFALWLILTLLDANYRPKFSWLWASFAIFLGIVVVADLNSEFVLKSVWSNFERMDGLVTIAHLFAYFIVLSAMFLKRATWNYILYTMLVAASALSCYGFFQLAGFLNINQGGIRVDGTLGNSTYFAIYLVFHAFFALLLALNNKGREWSGAARAVITAASIFVPLIMFGFLPQNATGGEGREIFAWLIALFAILSIALSFLRKEWLYLFLTAVYSFILYYTATRGAILGFIGGVLLAALLLAFFEKEDRGLKRISWVTIIAVLVLILGFISVREADFVKNSPVLNRFATISLNETKTQARAYVWPMAIAGFKERPILGWGQESFNYVFNKYYNPAMYNHETWFDRTHNVFLDWLIAGGILGLLGYLSLYILGIWALWKKTNFTFPERAVLTGLFAAYIFHNFFVFDNLISYILFVVLLSYIHASSGREFPNWLSALTRPLTNLRFAGISIASVVIIVATVYGVYSMNVKAIASNKTLITAIDNRTNVNPSERLEKFKTAINYNAFGGQEIREQLFQAAMVVLSASSISAQDKEAFFQYAKAQFEEMIKEAPNDARHYLFFGILLNTHGNYEEGLRMLQKAQELSPKKQAILFEVARIYLIGGNKDMALQIFKQALDLAPGYVDARINYATAAIYAGRGDIANQTLIEGFGTTAYPNEQLLRVYYETKQFDQILGIWQSRVKADPNNAKNHAGVAAAYLQLGRKIEAKEALEKARDTELDPKNKAQYQQFINDLVAGKNILQ